MAMDGSKRVQEYSPRATSTTSTSFKRALGFVVAAALLSVLFPFLAPFCSRLPSMSSEVVVYFDVDRSTLFFFCNALLLFLARDSGVLAFFAPANAGMHDAESDVRTAVPDGGSKSAAVSEGDEKVGVLERHGSNLELENVNGSEFISASAVKSVETTGDVLLEEADLFSSDLELAGDGTDDEETDPAEDVQGPQEEHEDLEEFNRRCDEFIARMKSGKRIDHAVGVAAEV